MTSRGLYSWVNKGAGSITFLRVLRAVAVAGFMLSFYLIIDTALRMDTQPQFVTPFSNCRELGLKLVMRIILIQFHASILLWALDEVIHLRNTKKAGGA